MALQRLHYSKHTFGIALRIGCKYVLLDAHVCTTVITERSRLTLLPLAIGGSNVEKTLDVVHSYAKLSLNEHII
jgi:hypothetical protein